MVESLIKKLGVGVVLTGLVLIGGCVNGRWYSPSSDRCYNLVTKNFENRGYEFIEGIAKQNVRVCGIIDSSGEASKGIKLSLIYRH